MMTTNDNSPSHSTHKNTNTSISDIFAAVGPKRKSYLSLGSNLGDRSENLLLGIRELLKIDGNLKISRTYETQPIGGPEGQSNYYNAAVSLETSLHPHDLLRVVNSIEYAAKRVRKERFGPRTLDIDILFMEGVLMSSDNLTIPHPRMHERGFVLAPLSDLVNITELTIFTAIYPIFSKTFWRDVLRCSGANDDVVELNNVNIDPRSSYEI